MLWQELSKARYEFVFLSLLFAFFAYFFRAYRWKLLIEPLNHRPSLTRIFFSLMTGYLANFAFPRIGEVTRCAVLNRTDKIPVDSLIGTVIIERTIDLIVLLFLLLFLFIFKLQSFGKFIYQQIFKPLSRLILDKVPTSLAFWLFIIAFFIVLIVLLYYFRRQLRKTYVFKQMRSLLKGIVAGIATVARLKSRTAFVIHTLLIWIFYYLMTYILVFSIPATSGLNLMDGLFILVIGGLGMSLPVQGGIGAFHWITSMGLTLYGISREDGLVFATLAHESQSVFAIALGLISITGIFIFTRRLKRKQGIV